MAKSAIEWTDYVWNPVTGCTKVSQGCKNCYAEGVANRFFARQYPPNEDGSPRQFTDVRCHPERLDQPLHWRKPGRVFVNSMSDLFHEAVPNDFIDRVFAVMWLAKWHTFQVLTKRAERMRRYCESLDWERCRYWMNLAADGGEHRPGAYSLTSLSARRNKWAFIALSEKSALARLKVTPPLPNVCVGVSVENQQTADERIPVLLQTPAAARWISAEPLLGPIDLRSRPTPEGVYVDWLTPEYGLGVNTGADPEAYLKWVVCGGESGPEARPMHPDWARALRDQCQAAGVPFFFKQWGEWLPPMTDGNPDHSLQHLNASDEPVRVGKKAAGRLLDGREWNEYPAVSRELAAAKQ